MPAIVGPVMISTINGGSVQFGDVLNMSPKASAKTNFGSGGDNIGIFVATNNGISLTNTATASGIDQPITGNL